MELKSAALTLIAVVLKTTDLNVLASELEQRARVSPGLFDEEPVALDLSQVREPEQPLSFPDLIALFRRHHMLPVAARRQQRADGGCVCGRPGRGPRGRAASARAGVGAHDH